MPDNAPVVLATRSLPDLQYQRIAEAGISLQQHDFIRVEHQFDPLPFRERLLHSSAQARVFTSKNSVYSLRKLLKTENLKNLPTKKTFTVGIKATEMLAALGLTAAARADNAISLAQIIARNKDVAEVDFFCGSQSLNDLPEYLESKGITVNREIVYQTELDPQPLDTANLAGAVFLSPTAVYSFFKKNRLSHGIPGFCIGATTAEAMRLRCDNPRILAREPQIDSVVDRVIEYFNSQRPEPATGGAPKTDIQ